MFDLTFENDLKRTTAIWIRAVESKLMRLGCADDAAAIEAQDIWEILSDYGREPAAALAYDPADAARDGMREFEGDIERAADLYLDSQYA